jgi:hypothetical protein
MSNAQVKHVAHLYCYSLDSTDSSGFGRLVRKHTTDANAYVSVITVNQKPTVCLFAKQHLNAGEEIVISPGVLDSRKVCSIDHEQFNLKLTPLCHPREISQMKHN